MARIVSIEHKGDFSKTVKFLNRVSNGRYLKNLLNGYGEAGVRALSKATPVDTGLTANSWSYEVTIDDESARIEWFNSNLGGGWCPIALILQYGHATRNGGWVEGRDYINPAMRPIFDELAASAWKEVTKE